MAKRDDIIDIDELRERYREAKDTRDFFRERGWPKRAANEAEFRASLDAARAAREAEVARRAGAAEAAQTLPWQRRLAPEPVTRPDRPSALAGAGAAGTTAVGRVLGGVVGATTAGEVVVAVAGVAALFAAAVYLGVRLRRWWEGWRAGA